MSVLVQGWITPVYGLGPGIFIAFLLTLLIILIIVLVPVVWVYWDASRRGNRYAVVWAIGALVTGLVTVIFGYVVAVIYYFVRDKPENWWWVIAGRVISLSVLIVTFGIIVLLNYTHRQNVLFDVASGLAQFLLPLTTILIFMSTIAVHFDRRYVTANSDWNPSKLYYLVGFPDGVLSTLLAVIYLYKRHHHIGLP